MHEEIEVLDKRIEGRNEWLERVKNMSDKELERQQKSWRHLVSLAACADAAYGTDINKKLEDSGFVETTEKKYDSIIQKYSTGKDGFQCHLFENSEGKYILAFRGTEFKGEPIKDGKADVKGAITNKDPQTQAAINVTKDLIAAGIDPKDIQLTGHSLGGRLAAESAISNKLTAYTFNSAGISDETRKEIVANNSYYEGKVINILSSNEPLNKVQNTISSLTANEYVNNDFVNSINNKYTKKIASALGGGPIVHAQGKDIRTIGGNLVIEEAYGKDKDEAHSISFLRQSIEQRYSDINKTYITTSNQGK